MYVNPFWFGVLMTIVVGVVIVIVLSLIFGHRDDDQDDQEADSFEIDYDAVKELDGKVGRIHVMKNGAIRFDELDDDDGGEES